MKVLVNKSPYTGELFECDREYLRHMDRQRHRAKANEAARLRRLEFDKFVAGVSQLHDIDEICRAVNGNIWMIAKQVGYHWAFTGKHKDPGSLDRVSISINKLHFGYQSTSHCAPRGQRKYWCGGSETRELGWRGRIHILLDGRAPELFHTDQLEAVGIHTGTGGGGNNKREYDITLFAKDFQAMARPLVWPMLIEKTQKQLGHT